LGWQNEKHAIALSLARIYFASARNGLGATAVGCYSPRAQPYFPSQYLSPGPISSAASGREQSHNGGDFD
jgi:hypothetical protein